MRFAARGLLWLALAAAPAAGSLAAQVGSTTDVLTGLVKDDTGQPVPDAVVEATSLETQVMRTTKTDARGRYTLLFPDGGGQYRLIVRSIGKTPVMRTIARLADEDRLVTNLTLGAVPTRLQEIVVRATADRGSTPAGDLLPGVHRAQLYPEPDGQAADRRERPQHSGDARAGCGLGERQRQYRRRVLGGGAAALEQQHHSRRPDLRRGDSAAGRGAQHPVITNSYDVARGQFSGGQVASTTRSGTNTLQGSGNYSLRDRELSVSSGDSTAFAQGYSQQQLSAGFGGPLARNKAFWFLSGQGRLRDDGLQSLLTASPASLTRLGLAPDSANRFLGFLTQNGLPLEPIDSTTSRSADDFSGLARLDLNLTATQTLTLRGDARQNRTEPTGVGTLSVPASGGSTHSRGGGGMATLSSRLGPKLINELRAYYSGSSQRGESFSDLPQGRVQVVSALDGGTQSVSN
jgi:hypothetical protein